MIFICNHNEKGAVGVIINKLIPNMSVCNILKRLQINTEGVRNLEIHFGGLEEMDKCFIIHSDDYMSSGSKLIVNNIAISMNEDVTKVATSSGGGGPHKKLLCMGCCIWVPEQLENEVASSYWIPIDADEALIFGDSSVDKWSKALLKIGSSTNLFSDLQGNA
jgi:putative transcriptional regulator